MVGGGISGLTAAYRLSRLLPDARIELFEASERLGGVLHTRCDDGYLIEFGADSFIDKLPAAVELCHELGLADEIIPTNEYPRRALVLYDGSLHRVPSGFVQMRAEEYLPMLRSPILSWRGKLRLLAERWIAKSPMVETENYDESVASFASRRLGREVFERLVQPLLAGIYTADAEKLSTAATMVTAIDAERQHGSLRAATLNARRNQQAASKASGARYASFVTLRSGLDQLVRSLADHLTDATFHLETPVDRIRLTTDDRWSVGAGSTDHQFDAIVVALPAPRAAQLLAPTNQALSSALFEIPYASSAVAALVYRRDQIADELDGFGMVVPSVEGRKIVAASYSSIKFPNRVPDGHVLLRVFVGGALQSELLDHTDEQLLDLAHSEVGQILRITGGPVRRELVRWQEKMPQYHVGHLQLVDRIEQLVATHRRLALAGNAYHGVGIPQCVRSGELAAKSIAESFRL